MRYLRPDVITFQEIPFELSWQMTNFVQAFLPGYFLAGNSGTDGYLRSGVLSRFPITRSASWLARAPLDAFGNANRFTRDLFEAEIALPELKTPLHVFTVHLKSGTAAEDAARRAAEASAISNFFVNVFLPAHGGASFVLTGDLNEDLMRPPAASQQPLDRLVNAATGLRLTTPLHGNSDERTWSARFGLQLRYDYVLPGGRLFTNLVHSQVFSVASISNRTAAGLPASDGIASDHLPLLMVFRSPDAADFQITRITPGQGGLELSWEALPEFNYRVETSTHLPFWSPDGETLQTTGTNLNVLLKLNGPERLFRVRRDPAR